MIYDYKCDCGHRFHVTKPMSESDTPESCTKCSSVAVREYYPTRGFVKNFEAAYYPALGKAFTSKKELDYHLDKNNLVCIGNDYGSGEKMHKTIEEDRQKQQEKSWEKLINE